MPPRVSEERRRALREARTEVKERMSRVLAPRGLSIPAAAHYIGVSPPAIVHFLNTGALSEVRYPGREGALHYDRSLIDKNELDDLIERCKSKRPDRTE
jgi:hypothetical protein